jgi:hypothetical protein
VGWCRVPFLEGDGERVLDGFLGESDVTEETRQRGHAPSVFGPVDAVQVHACSFPLGVVEGAYLDR